MSDADITCAFCGEPLANNAHKIDCTAINTDWNKIRNKTIFNGMYGKFSNEEIKKVIREAYKGGVFPAIKFGDMVDVNSAYPELTKTTPKNLYALYVDDIESAQIIAIWEKTGALGSVVAGIRAAQNAKGV